MRLLLVSILILVIIVSVNCQQLPLAPIDGQSQNKSDPQPIRDLFHKVSGIARTGVKLLLGASFNESLNNPAFREVIGGDNQTTSSGNATTVPPKKP